MTPKGLCKYQLVAILITILIRANITLFETKLTASKRKWRLRTTQSFLQPPKRLSLSLQETPYTAPDAYEVVVKTTAVAINTMDCYKQILGDAFLPYIKIPCVPGNDLAGQVVEVGSAITRFKPGDRVLAEAAGTADFGNRAAEGAFQEYVLIREHLTSKNPASASYERAAILPLAFSTSHVWRFKRWFQCHSICCRSRVRSVFNVVA
jgi:NADPH:quinone reductase-like Zn-dependent oxidoreductase